jgi:dTDP-4-dehydrorhamnose 3,5-epimerase
MGEIEGVLLTPLKIVGGTNGDVMHALKMQEPSFCGFGEAYFSTVMKGRVKGWKRHRQMVLNLVVPSGNILFVLFDQRKGSPSFGVVQEFQLGKGNYQRLTVPPGIWMAFKGVSEESNILLNIASIPHDPLEAENLALDNDLIPYKGFKE